jgi:hypothetical protein
VLKEVIESNEISFKTGGKAATQQWKGEVEQLERAGRRAQCL